MNKTPVTTQRAISLPEFHSKTLPPKLMAMMKEHIKPAKKTMPSQSVCCKRCMVEMSGWKLTLGRRKSIAGATNPPMTRLM